MCEAPAATLNGQDSYGLATPATRLYMLCIWSWAALVEMLLGSTLLKNEEAWLEAAGVSWLAGAEEVG